MSDSDKKPKVAREFDMLAVQGFSVCVSVYLRVSVDVWYIHVIVFCLWVVLPRLIWKRALYFIIL